MKKASMGVAAAVGILIVSLLAISLIFTGGLVSVRADGPEVCDGSDNDGDNYTDEYDDPFFGGPRYVGQSCHGLGECEFGTVECKAGSNEVDCSTNPGGSEDESEPETDYDCGDGLDNDCDGSVDEDFVYEDPEWGDRTLEQSCNGIGECSIGVVYCADTSTADCSTNPGGGDYDGSPETCNSLDDDCDAATDEDGVCNVGILVHDRWNLISFPFEPVDTSIEVVLADIMDNVIVVNTFEPGGVGAKTYDPQEPESSDLEYMDNLHGYWIKVNETVDLVVECTDPSSKTVTLGEGWNLISYICNSFNDVEDVFGSIMDDVIVINSFDNSGGAKTYNPNLPPMFSDLEQMKPGFGYWVKMSNPAELDYSTVC